LVAIFPVKQAKVLQLHPMTLPPAFEARMKAQLGADYPAFAASLQQPASVSLRVNASKLDGRPDLVPVPWAAHGYYLPERPLFTLDPWLHAGGYYVQEPSSMLLAQAIQQHLPLGAPLLALDLCAAPGGKSTHLSSLLPAGSLLVSNEVIRSRGHILAENVQKWGSGQVVVTQNDPRDVGALPAMFDLMVIDAPCSGEGLFRKDADAIGEWSEGNLSLCLDRQRRILADAWPALKPGGLLVYSTCTFFPGENEQNLAWLAQEEALTSLPLTLDPAWGFEAVEVQGMMGYRALPHRVRGEGFFMAVLRKDGSPTNRPLRSSKRSTWAPVPKATRQALAEWTTVPEDWTWVMMGELCCALPGGFPGEWEAIGQGLRVHLPGLALAEVKRKDFRPAHALALTPWLQAGVFPQIEVQLDDAIAFLRKDEMQAELPTQGWCLIAYGGLPLGWVKALPRRVNNYYPPHWKIRMPHRPGDEVAFLLAKLVRQG
jgi:16S rRNA C967 or C1407 C5-methylase (RsmB/RsmF family)/NOL1/NOP2/fmu family ribosome biogenesis protein